jgi:acetaldehyde dehydrogenase/alcohol dehydrogenase
VAPEKYAQITWVIGLGGKTEEIARERLFTRVDELLERVGMPRSLAEAGVPRDQFEAALPDLTRTAFGDASLKTNPRIPMIAELADLLRAGYDGR